VKVIEILFFKSASVHENGAALMQYHGGKLPLQRRVSFDLLSLPVVAFQVQTPQAKDMLVADVVLSSIEIHHVVVYCSRVCIDVAEGCVIEKMGLMSGPYF